MRVKCKECGSKGFIGTSDEKSLQFTTLYCHCLDARCGHTWVANLAFSHTLSPSSKAVDRLLFDRLKDMPRAQQRDLFELLGAQSTV